MFRFLHAADVHLDSPLRGLDRYQDAPDQEIRGATRRALVNLVDLAMAERVAFVVLAGDLYDGDWPCYNTGVFFRNQMARLRDASIPVVLIRGNHDAENRMTRDLQLPENVRVLASDRPETLRLDAWGVSIHGQGFATRRVIDDLSVGYPPADRGRFNIGLLHTCAEGNTEHARYAPCSLDGLRGKGYQYWALGHIHKREHLRVGDPWIVFPGNIQGRHIKEAGPKGCTLVAVDDRLEVAGVEHRSLDVVRWEPCRVDALGAADGDEIAGRLADRLDDLARAADDRLLAVRVQVTGACPAHARFAAQPERWTHEFRTLAHDRGGGRIWVEAVKLQTRPTDELEAAFAPDGPLAELAGLVESARTDADRLAALALDLDDLRRKLPAEFRDELAGPERLREALESVVPILFDRLGAGGEGR